MLIVTTKDGNHHKVKDIHLIDTHVTLETENKNYEFEWAEYNQKTYKDVTTTDGVVCTINKARMDSGPEKC